MDNLKRIFGRRLRAWRKKRGKTQEQIAKMAKIDVKYVSEIERGNKGVSFEAIARLARALDVDAFQLFIPDRLMTHDLESVLELATSSISNPNPEKMKLFLDELRLAAQKLNEP